MAKNNQIAKLVTKETGMSLKDFCETHLYTNYKAFQYRIRNNRCYPNEIMYLSWFLGESVEDLFGDSFLELMQDQGPDELTVALKKMYKEANTEERKRMLGLIGHIITNVTTADQIPTVTGSEAQAITVTDKGGKKKKKVKKSKPTLKTKTPVSPVAPKIPDPPKEKKIDIDDIFQDDIYDGGNIRR